MSWHKSDAKKWYFFAFRPGLNRNIFSYARSLYPGVYGINVFFFNFELIVLDLFGSVYTDADVVYLKDMRMFWFENFAYRWSSQAFYNTAVMGLNKYLNPSILVLYERICHSARTLGQLIEAFHPVALSSKLQEISKENQMFNFESIKSYHRFIFFN
jgi:hypothetical protein